MIDQIFRVTIDGVVRTSSVETANMTEGIRVYQVASFDFDIKDDFTPVPELDVIIEYGDKAFHGFIYEVTKVSKGMLSLECRSYSARLTEPYHSSNDSQIEDSTTSHGLCAEYATRYGIPINITAADIDFGGNFEREGTPLSALTAIAETTGAEIWWDGTTLQIQPNKAITENGTVIYDYQVFDYVPDNNTIYQRGIKYVVIDATIEGTPSTSFTVQNTIDAQCSVDLDGCDGFVSAFIVPHTTYQTATGVSLSLVNKPLVYSENMSPSKTVSVDAHIKSVSKVTINGSQVSGYSVGYNTLTFSSEKRGMIVVEYIGYVHEGLARINNKSGGRYIEFDIYYNQDKRYSRQGYLNCTSSDDGYSDPNGRYYTTDNNDEDITITTPLVMNYEKGFDVQTQGGEPVFTFFANSEPFRPDVVTTQKTISILEAGRLSARDSGDFIHQLGSEPVSLVGVTSSGVDITSSATLEGDLVVFDKNYSNVSISYTSDVDSHHVQFDDSSETETIYTMNISDEDFILSGRDADDMNSAPCILGETVPISMVSKLNVTLEEVIGKQVTVTYPSDLTTSLTVDSMGMIYVPNIENGDHDIDITSISETARMILLSGAK